jgi:hypothetical protein
MIDGPDPGTVVIDDRQYLTQVVGIAILLGVIAVLCASIVMFGPAPVTFLILVSSVVFVRLAFYVYSIPYFSISHTGMKFPKEIQGFSSLNFADIIRARLARTGPGDDGAEYMVLLLRDGSRLKIRPDRDLEKMNFRLLRECMNLDYEKRRISFISAPHWDGIV